MIVVPSGERELAWCQQFYQKRSMIVTADAHWLVWSTLGTPQWVIAFDAWMGSTCQLSMASRHPSPPARALIKATFRHGFGVLKRTHMFGFVNSTNISAMKLDQWLGFREIYRVPKAHENSGDIVVFDMTPAECRWLKD